MDSPLDQLHIVMIPLMCPGHLIPMVDMAKLLAQRAVTVTIVATPRNAIRFGAVIGRAIESGLPIRLLEIRFPALEAGLPEGCESVDDLPSLAMSINFFAATKMLQEPVEKMLKDIKPSPSCILSDKHVFWTSDTAKKLQIPWIMFDGMSCFTQLCTENIYNSKVHESVSSESESFVVRGLPDHIEFTKAQLPGLFNQGSVPAIDEIRKQVRATEVGAYGVVINSFEELEQDYVDEFKKVRGDKVWCVGPLSLNNKNMLDKAQRGHNNASIDGNKCLQWLDNWANGSVIYACLGSISSLTCTQLMELALGLEASERPFVWVVRAGGKQKEIEKWILEEGFEESTKGRGLLIRGWAPQVLILSHPAIGGFVTHCGWNSTIEGICSGVPMITWPLFAEQFFNEKLVVQVLETGVSVGAKEVMPLGEEEKFGVKVRSKNVKEAIECIMLGGQEGQERRKRARELAKEAVRAVEEGGSSHLNITLLIEDIMKQTKGEKKNPRKLS
uniref:Glycosyltransferase n=1 Tax=Panax ginseng TaxID=4054 RepID=A0A0A7H7P4_PANGI|nr:UDP-glycosyltransferase [Panax ginseng]